ncbi:MAG TPA: hypothetical protein VFG89_05125 [Coriobacteriia bacterium]|nr:hypothetical protein [Coriobacteriia bacterium]
MADSPEAMDSATPAASEAAHGAVPSAPAGREALRLHSRSAGYCVACDRIVERDKAGKCENGHPEEFVTGCIELAEGEQAPALPRFSLAAFALPPVWGPAHGLWVGVLFLPIWLFADSVLSTASLGPAARAGAVVVMVLTLAFQAFFAKRASGLAWRRVADRVSVQDFVRMERIWALACVPAGMALLAWALYYRFFMA